VTVSGTSSIRIGLGHGDAVGAQSKETDVAFVGHGLHMGINVRLSKRFWQYMRIRGSNNLCVGCGEKRDSSESNVKELHGATLYGGLGGLGVFCE
jgi:hypothetical protein